MVYVHISEQKERANHGLIHCQSHLRAEGARQSRCHTLSVTSPSRRSKPITVTYTVGHISEQEEQANHGVIHCRSHLRAGGASQSRCHTLSVTSPSRRSKPITVSYTVGHISEQKEQANHGFIHCQSSQNGTCMLLAHDRIG